MLHNKSGNKLKIHACAFFLALFFSFLFKLHKSLYLNLSCSMNSKKMYYVWYHSLFIYLLGLFHVYLSSVYAHQGHTDKFRMNEFVIFPFLKIYLDCHTLQMSHGLCLRSTRKVLDKIKVNFFLSNIPFKWRFWVSDWSFVDIRIGTNPCRHWQSGFFFKILCLVLERQKFLEPL